MKRLRLKDLGTFKTGLTYSPDNICEPNEGVLVLRSANIQDDILDLGDCVYVNNDIPSWMRVKKGDILICSRNGSANLVGKTAIINSDINATWGAFMMLLRTRYNSNYINYLLNIIIRREKARFSTSTINQLTNSMLGGIVVDIFEDAKEQQRIVEYLDAKTTEIDKKIELLGKKRDTYKRLKTATINRAVTRGLDEHVPLKDSGMDWIGQIPEHWDVKRTKDVCSSIFTGATPSTTNDEYWDGDIPWIPSGCCHDCYIKEAPKFITQEGFANSSTRWIPSGTTVMAITGATCAQLGILKIDACANQSVVAFIENKKKLDARYLFYVLRSERGIILTNRTGGAQAGVDTGDCMKILICVPPLSEQKQIAVYLDDRCAKIDEAVTIIDKQIDALKRLKRSLINEVVTGKRMV